MAIEVPGVSSYNSVAAPPQDRANNEEALGKTAFLELMIAQIKNQDPLEPAKNEAFIAQLAQFSSLEGIQNLNESMDGLVGSLRAGMTMDAAALVGRNVLAPSNQSLLNANGGISGTINIDEPTTDLKLEIRDAAGAVVKRFELGPQTESELRFDWDGTTDADVPATQGIYKLSAYTEIDGARSEYELSLPQQVVSVSIEEGGLIANLVSGTSVPAAQIKEIQ
jgi:flagellar basal-body rod modification protein FlgD